MKYLNLKKQITLCVIVAFAFTSCDKPKTVEPMGDAGQTLVKIIGGGTPASLVKSPVDFVPTPTQLLAVDLRRDIPSATELNRVMIVTVKDDTAAVRAKDPSYIQLPTAWYTIQSSAVKTGGQGGTYTFTFKAGEFAQQIYITIPNATLFNPSALYGLGFTITTADANGIISSQKSVVIEIGAKNAYDGIYAVTGPMVELTGAPWTQWNDPTYPDPFPAGNAGAWEGHLITSGANTCYLLDNTIWGCCGHPMLNGGANSGFGSFGIVVDFNPATGAVADVHNYYGDPAYGGSTALGNPQSGTGAPMYMSNANTRRATLDPSGINAVQGNKDVLIKYFMNQSSVIPASPNIRITFNEKWQYIGPR